MSGEDPIDDGMALAATAAASAARVAEVLLKQAQDLKLKQAHEARASVAEAATQLAARAEVAEAFYREACSAEWLSTASAADLRAAVEGVHVWAEVAPDRFGEPAESMREALITAYRVDVREAYAERRDAAAIADLASRGVLDARVEQVEVKPVVVQDLAQAGVGAGYDTAEARRARESAMVAAGVDQELVTARMVSDKMNAHDPATAAASAGGVRTKAAVRSHGKSRDQQRGR